MNERILCISDLHLPFQHPDAFAFLKAVRDKYKPDRVVCLGDEGDAQGFNFHDKDVDLPGAGDELLLTIQELKKLYKLFPEVDVVDSNHGSMALRKMKFHGIPLKYLRPIEEVLEAPPGWHWKPDLKLTMPNGQLVYFHHGLKKNGLAVAQQMGMSVVQGHYHTVARIDYSSSPSQLYWSMQVGCLIDHDSLAFAYDKTNLGRPILSVGIIINSTPVLIPMITKNKRWIKKLTV